jgi:hypothetical protein
MPAKKMAVMMPYQTLSAFALEIVQSRLNI